MTLNYIGDSKMKPIDVSELFNIKYINDEYDSTLNINKTTDVTFVS